VINRRYLLYFTIGAFVYVVDAKRFFLGERFTSKKSGEK